MSVYNAMRTSVSGMAAQANRLATHSENVANVDTTGYKAASAQFQTLLISQTSDSYTSGGVDTRVRYGIDQQGVLNSTASATDLAVSGQGFFVVSDANGAQHLTRAGSFIPDAQGNLINIGGYKLQGVDISAGPAPTSSTGFGGLSDVKINMTGLISAPSSAAAFAANLPSMAAVVPGADLPSANGASATPTAKASLVAYNNLGEPVTLDIFMTKTAANTWETTVFDHAAAGPLGGFPYTAGPLSTAILNFDATTGRLPAPPSLSVAVPNGMTIPIDMANMTQLGASYSISNSAIDGNAPSRFSSVRVDTDGIVSAVYQNGKTVDLYQIQLATVPSINNLLLLAGNIYDVNEQSGQVLVGQPQTGAFGDIVANALENSTVDIASELTSMIETQRSYTANSKAFTIASDMTDVIVNLKV